MSHLITGISNYTKAPNMDVQLRHAVEMQKIPFIQLTLFCC